VRPLQVLKVSQVYPPNGEASGQAVKVEAISRHLAGLGHRVTVLTASPGCQVGPARDHGVDIVTLRSVARYRAHTIAPGVVRYCLDRLRSFDVVHVYGTYDLLGPVVAAFSRRWGIPYVVEPLGMFRPIVRNVGLKRAYRRLLGWPLVMGAEAVIATSELERGELVADGVPASKIVVRRNGLDLVQFNALPGRGAFRREVGIPDDVPLILYLGRLSRKKGLDLLLEAFPSLQESAVLAIVGPDDGDGCLQEIAQLRMRLRLDGRVRVVGPRFGADKTAAFADADVFVLPSRSENFGNAAAEAVACGVPVVVTDRCGIAPLVRDRAGLVVPCEMDALAGALRRLIEDADLRSRFRAGARAMREELSWDEPIAQMERLYLEIVGRSRAS